MISNQARKGFDFLLTRSLQASLSTSAESCEIAVVSQLPEIEKHETVILTVSSYLFRLMVMIHFKSDASTMDHIARMNGMQAQDMSKQSFHDAIAEYGNLCCGILNRDLGAFFPHIGMSTPNFIGGQCMTYVEMLDCAHIQHFKIHVNDVSIFHVSLCVSAYEELDFVVNENEESANTGELELF